MKMQKFSVSMNTGLAFVGTRIQNWKGTHADNNAPERTASTHQHTETLHRVQ